MSDLVYRSPEHDVIAMRLVFAGDVFIRNWTHYEFSSNYETPTDGWSFTIGDDNFPQRLKEQLYPGQLVEFSVNGLVQCVGFIDKIRRHVTRGSGTEWEIIGRDSFGPVVDAHIDPRIQFKRDTTLEQLIRQVFDSFAPMGGDWEYSFDSEANHKVKTGRPRGRQAKAGSKRGRGKKKIDQLRPSQHEGAYAFAAKVAHRQGLTIQPSADGTTVIVDDPTYDQEPTHTLVRTSEFSNILDGSVEWSIMDQPSIIIADGVSGGGEFGHSKVMAKMVNPFTGVDTNGQMWPEVKLVSDRYPQAKELYFSGITFGTKELRWPRFFHARPLYLHDEVARTDDELELYLRREMSTRVRRALVVHYTVEGHGQYLPDGQFVPYEVDTIIRVKDEPGGLDAAMWVLARTFEKSRSGGTTTKLELMIPGTLQFGDQ